MDFPALDLDNPKTQFWLGLAGGLFANSGASRYPVGLGPALGAGLQQGLMAQKLAQQEQMQKTMMALQQNKLQKDIDAQDFFNRLYGPNAQNAAAGGTQQNPSVVLTPQAISQLPQSPTGANGPSLADIGRLGGLDVERGKFALQLWQAQHPELKFEGGVPLDPRTGRPVDGVPSVPQTNQQGGSTITQWGPNGYSVGVTPGSLEALRALNAEGARYSFEPVKLASGETVPVSRLDLAEGRGPKLGGPRNPQPAPAQPPSLDPLKKDPWSNIPMRRVPNGMGQSTYNEGLAKAQAEAAAKLSEKYGTVATENNQRIALNNQALEMIDKADTGPGAAQIADVKNILVSRFGVSESAFENTPSATAVLQKDLLNAATQKAKQQFGARMTQSEVMLMLKRGAPNVDMPKAAMKYLLESDNAQMKYGIKQGSDLGRYLQAGGDPHQFESWYAKSFPMTSDMGKVHLDAGRRPPLSSFQK